MTERVQATNAGRRRSNAAIVNVAGLALAAAGMLLQIVAGSTLYPTLAGPIVLLATSVIVAFRPGRWTRFAALVVPLVLGVGAAIAAALTGEFIAQLADAGNAGILLGSLMHVVGLVAAIAGGVGMLRDGGEVAALER